MIFYYFGQQKADKTIAIDAFLQSGCRYVQYSHYSVTLLDHRGNDHRVLASSCVGIPIIMTTCGLLVPKLALIRDSQPSVWKSATVSLV